VSFEPYDPIGHRDVYSPKTLRAVAFVAGVIIGLVVGAGVTGLAAWCWR